MSSATRPLITRTLARPVRRELPGRDAAKLAKPADRADARKGQPGRRDAAHDIAERMLAELTW